MPSTNQQAWNPAHYDRAGAFVPKLAADLLELAAIEPGQRVLDLGCGTGDLTRKLALAGARPLGLDASVEMVSEARRKFPELELVVGDGQELRYDAEFDVVFSNATLHWMKRAEDVARGVHRALRPGGRFVAEFGGARCVQTVRDAVAAELDERGLKGRTSDPDRLESFGSPDWYFPSVAQYSRVLDDAGLWVRTALWFERPTLLEGEGGLRHWLELFCLPLLRALGAARQDFETGVEERCRKALFRDGSWWLDYTRLRVVATKPG